MNPDVDIIKKYYKNLDNKIQNAKNILNRPLTLAEKILIGHLTDEIKDVLNFKNTYVNLQPDRVAMQDATAQMALLQFMLAGKDRTAVPTTVHCDHLIRAKSGADADLSNAIQENKEVYEFLSAISTKYGIGFSSPGTGIIHQIIFENYAFPGGLIIGTDSHTPNAGGLTMLGVGVGGADAVDAMVGMPWELKWPKIIGVKLTGKLQGWASPKDIILKLLGILTVKGGTGAIIEYFGDGTKSLSATGKATITNMGAELGATSSVFEFDEKIYDYLVATNRESIADLAKNHAKHLQADPEIFIDPSKYYDQIVEINLNDLEPHVAGPFTPDLVNPISKFKQIAKENKYPLNLKAGLIGSCTNSSYEDLSKVASILLQALEKGIKPKALLYVSPGSELIKETIERDKILNLLSDCGAIILANACGPCIGQWVRLDVKENTPNSIITSFNRNFKARNDGNPETLAFIASPELIAAMVISGRIDFDPSTETIINDYGITVSLTPPKGTELPLKGFLSLKNVFQTPKTIKKKLTVIISEKSDRLQMLKPFEPWNKKDEIENSLVLLKISGKCTTDHISPAGKWLKYRGHLENISQNLYMGATNAFTKEIGKGTNYLTNTKNQNFHSIAKDYKSKNRNWVVIGDENYGEGSSREHAAMEPRFLGCRAIISKSFARIAENNLKKQGIVVATFVNPKDYDKIMELDTVTIKGLKDLKPGSKLIMELTHSNNSTETIELQHSFSDYQIDWFKSGSALNLIRDKVITQ